jgi:uncharacterized protein YegP (UPF0339 family)
VHIELHRGKGRQPWYLVLVAANGEKLAVSEGYFSKWNAKRAARKNFAGIPLQDKSLKNFKL